jgi:para-aminobenzoate synthetase/4-amino-4-deoxychorismate lyase
MNQTETFKLIETIAWHVDKGYVCLEGHLMRLLKSSKKFNVKCPIDSIQQHLLQISKSFKQSQIVRLLLDRNGICECTNSPLENNSMSIPIYISPIAINSKELLWQHKTTAEKTRGFYTYWRQQVQKKQPGSDVVFFNEHRIITEAPHFNLFIEDNKQLITSPISAGLLPGILRAQLIKNRKCIVKPIQLTALLNSNKIWLGNSVRGLIKAELKTQLEIPRETDAA